MLMVLTFIVMRMLIPLNAVNTDVTTEYISAASGADTRAGLYCMYVTTNFRNIFSKTMYVEYQRAQSRRMLFLGVSGLSNSLILPLASFVVSISSLGASYGFILYSITPSKRSELNGKTVDV